MCEPVENSNNKNSSQKMKSGAGELAQSSNYLMGEFEDLSSDLLHPSKSHAWAPHAYNPSVGEVGAGRVLSLLASQFR